MKQKTKNSKKKKLNADKAIGILYILIGGVLFISGLGSLLLGSQDFQNNAELKLAKSTHESQPRVFGETINNPDMGTVGDDEAFSKTCHSVPPDYNNDGIFDDSDVADFNSFYNQQSRLADLNDDSKVSQLDEGCLNMYIEGGFLGSSIGESIDIYSPDPGTTISGVMNILVDISDTVPELNIRYSSLDESWYPFVPPVYYVEIRDVSSLKKRDDGHYVLVFDSLAFPNGYTGITICDSTTTICANQIEYKINNSLEIIKPAKNAQVSGSQVAFQAKVSGEVSYLHFELIETSTGRVWKNKLIYETDSQGFFNHLFDTTGIPNSEYMVKTEFVTTNQLMHYNPSYEIWTITVNNEAAVEEVIEEEIPEEEVIEDIGDGETGDGISEEPAVEKTIISPPEIIWPEKDTRHYQLSTITGTVKTGYQVELYLDDVKLARITPSQSVDEKSNFRYSLTNPLIPGIHYIRVKAIKNGEESALSEKIYFRIRHPIAELVKPDIEKISGVETFLVEVKGEVSSVEIFGNIVDGLTNILFGKADRVPNTNFWSLTRDTSDLLNGKYVVFAKIKGLDGRFIQSSQKEYNIFNELIVSDGTSQPETTEIETKTPEEQVIEEISPISVEEIKEAENEKVAEEIVVETPTLITKKTIETENDPRTTGKLTPEKLKVVEVANFQPAAERAEIQENFIIFNGVGPSNAIVTLYIYSNPIVVTTKTDKNGNWSYTLEKPLTDGAHTAYVTITDQTGKVEEKSSPLAFFVKEARAISEQEFLRGDIDVEKKSNALLIYYILITIVVVLTAIIIYMIVRRKPRADNQIYPK